MMDLIALWAGRAILTLAAVIFFLNCARRLLCSGEMHEWEHVVDWDTGRLIEKQCVCCGVRVDAFRCWRCGGAWRSGLIGGCEICRKEAR